MPVARIDKHNGTHAAILNTTGVRRSGLSVRVWGVWGGGGPPRQAQSKKKNKRRTDHKASASLIMYGGDKHVGLVGRKEIHLQCCTGLLVEMRMRGRSGGGKGRRGKKMTCPHRRGGWGPLKVEQKSKVGLTTSQAECRSLLLYLSSHAKDNNHIRAQRGFNSAPTVE